VSGRAFVISSPSGGGKTTVVTRLRRRLPRLVRSVSVTTRPPRPGERDGSHYRFVSLGTYRRLRRTGGLLEWAKVHGAYYGTPKQPVLHALRAGRDVLLSIDVQGARQVRRALGRRAVLIFLLPPSRAQLRRRLLQRRTDSLATIRRRLAAARRELACATWYDHRVVNDRLEHAVTELVHIIRKPRGQHGASTD
jgi:guanylate kinase